MFPGAEPAPRVNVVARCSFLWWQAWCGSLLRMGHLMGPRVFPIRDHQHLFLEYFGKLELVPGQNQEVQEHV